MPWPRSSLMASLSPAEATSLMQLGTRVNFARGHFLLREGEPGGALFLVLSGYVKVIRASAGAEVVLAVRGRGDLLGEFAVIDGRPRTATIVALDPLSAIRISGSRFLSFRAEHIAANEKVMQSLTFKMRRASDRSAATRAPDSHTRLAHMLYEVAIAHGVEQADGTLVLPPLTQADMADLAAVARSTVERILREFRDEGILISHYRQTIVLDVAGLRARARLLP
jgi:CRP/FNR family transcriptional regulator, cyclic AMP receptor protein